MCCSWMWDGKSSKMRETGEKEHKASTVSQFLFIYFFVLFSFFFLSMEAQVEDVDFLFKLYKKNQNKTKKLLLHSIKIDRKAPGRKRSRSPAVTPVVSLGGHVCAGQC